MRKNINQMKKIERQVKQMHVLEDIKKEREDREIANFHKNEIKMLDDIVKGKCK